MQEWLRPQGSSLPEARSSSPGRLALLSALLSAQSLSQAGAWGQGYLWKSLSLYQVMARLWMEGGAPGEGPGVCQAPHIPL